MPGPINVIVKTRFTRQPLYQVSKDVFSFRDYTAVGQYGSKVSIAT